MRPTSKRAKRRIDEICHKNGGSFSPAMVLRDAENSSSPLHAYFEWDDKKAGHLYRLGQARELIAQCTDLATHGREYVFVPSRECFMATHEAMASPAIWLDVTREMEREVLALLAMKERTLRLSPPPLREQFERFKVQADLGLKRLGKVARSVSRAGDDPAQAAQL